MTNFAPAMAEGGEVMERDAEPVEAPSQPSLEPTGKQAPVAQGVRTAAPLEEKDVLG